MDSVIVAPTRHRLSVDDYYRMANVGILGPEDRVELIDGELIDMAPIGSDHGGTVNRLTRALVMAFGERAVVSVQNPVRLDRFSEPQPDLTVLRPRDDFYSGGHAQPADVLLLVEVADSSLSFDRKVKLPLYARMGVGEVWIVDLRQRVIDAHQTPVGNAYTSTRTYAAGETVTLALAPDIQLPFEALLG